MILIHPIERRLNRPYIQFICTLILAIYFAVLTISFITNVRGRTIFGPYLGADFGAFYIAGRIFNTQSPDRIYDPRLHDRLYQEQFPDAPAENGLPYVNAPFFILPFTVLARLPYAWAYMFWLALSLALYVAAFVLLWRTLEGIPRNAWLVALLLSLSFMPFLVECLAGGQTSAIGFFCLAVAIVSERRGHYILSGLALSLCAYKPTLLVLILPMLVITRRYLTVVGFVAGCGVLAIISILSVGWQGCLGYINNLLYFANASTGTVSTLRSWKYVDINSFFRSFLENVPSLRWTLT
ncbi:MAG TPA: glycosyltransferase family 87 protein, partial [Pyrinomonadaceae bacterium]|nr:glycosyltransferase family 87 protein [Pyrinomonadaceae bacterium]